jgi:hypothetical protein
MSSGLVGRWKLDDNSNDYVVLDSSGLGNNGMTFPTDPAQYTSAMHIPGIVGSGALNFNGSSQYVSVGSCGVTATSATYAAWVNVTAFSSGYPAVVHSDVGANAQGIYQEATAGIILVAGTGSGGVCELILSSNYFVYGAAGWHHVAGTIDGANYNLYLDGVNSGVPHSDFSYNNAIQNAIGVGYAGNCFNGAIDDVRIYNRALSADEVLALYNNAPETTSSGNWFAFF